MQARAGAPIAVAVVFAVLVFVVGTSRPSAAVGVAEYTIVDLGVLPGTVVSEASALNNRGDVVGDASDDSGATQLFTYGSGALSAIGVSGHAYDINERGTIVGSVTAGSDSRAFAASGGTVRDLGTFGGAFSVARAVNERGDVVGEAQTAAGSIHAFLYRDGAMTDLFPGAAGVSLAAGINARGDIVGSDGHAWLYRRGQLTHLTTPQDSSGSVAVDVNERGEIVGTAGEVRGLWSEAFVYADGQLRLLGRDGFHSSLAAAINDAGEIVGELSQDAPGPNTHHGFVYRDGALHDLNTLVGPASEWTIENAFDINDHGEIAAVGTSQSGAGLRRHALLLVPSG
jgi:probable HAF family extracellular repeat protein